MNNYVIQGLGYLSILFLIISYQEKSASRLIVYQTLGSISYALHMGFLGALAGTASTMVFLLGNLVFYYKPKYKWAQYKEWVYLFSILYITTIPFTYVAWFSPIPIISGMLITISISTNNVKIIRSISFIVTPLYIIFGYMIGSNAVILNNILIFISIIVGMIRNNEFSSIKKVEV